MHVHVLLLVVRVLYTVYNIVHAQCMMQKKKKRKISFEELLFESQLLFEFLDEPISCIEKKSIGLGDSSLYIDEDTYI